MGGLSGCGDDLPAVTTEAGNSSSTSEATTTPTSGPLDTGVMTSDPGPTTDTPTGGDASTTAPTSAGPSTSDSDSDSDTSGATTDTGTGGNQAPVALSDTYVGKARQVLAPDAAMGVLKNDYDPDGDPLTVIASDPITANGADLTMPPDGSFTYQPPSDLWGDDSFKYKIYDGKDGFASTIVKVSLSPTAIPLAAIAAGKRGFAIDGATADDYSGRAVHHIGDLNKDGFGDLLVASPSAAGNTGRAYVVFGRSAGDPVLLAKLEDLNAGFEITGEAAGDIAGTSVSGAGDVNGDGIPDILIGAPKAATNGIASGAAYVVFGKADSTPVFLELVALGEGGFQIVGEASQHFAGHSVQRAGDVNGDGLADLVIGAYGAEPNGILSGRAYVVFGRDAGKPTALKDISAGSGGGFTINGEAAFDFAGSAVAGAGDVNGDGLDDVIVGAYGSDIVADTAGRAYVVFGKASATPVDLKKVAGGLGGFAIDGELAFDVAGQAVGGAGDFNGDGLADLLVGAPLADAGSKDAGRSYLVFGKKSTEAVKLAAVTMGVGGLAMDGQQVRDYSGFSVDGAGDVNGDGYDDIIIGAYGSNPMGDASGRSYVVFGKPDTQLTPLGVISNGDGGFAIDGEVSDDYSGFALAGAGDVNGDGFADVIVGAFGNDTKGDGAGRSYAVFGGDFSHLARSVGGSGPDNLAGTDAPEIFVAGRGDDVITGMGGADIVYCGDGSDEVRVIDLAFRRVDGGEGHDLLRITGAGLTLDLSTRPDNELVSLEEIDLADGDNTIVLARRDLLALTRVSHELTITGSKGAVEANLSGGGFVDKGVMNAFQVYSDGITTLRIALDLDKNVTL
ncbi:Ig-like domain-containing protein [Nannocystis sp.]|uniref:Ig-like domain-containing protein n=1 Tax=Nannocystis sp. TaxID=1962667 RepID=UPI0025D2B21E|nr:Ig-like domain-containing protein [Nannocystis sp.]MBK7824902.1 FG-GAP repeat protein [Nannocystis sp.]